jgi:hypothetical protein
MAEDILEKLKNIDPATLSEIVRKDQHSPSFEITEWSVNRFSNRGVISQDGLWLFNGNGFDFKGSRPWSIVLKIYQRQKPEPASSSVWHWKRELLFAQSGLPENMSGSVKTPLFYSAEETSDGAWIWMEHIKDAQPGSWGLDDFSFAARQLGCWNGAYLVGTPLPNETWLSRQQYRSFVEWMNLNQDIEFHLIQKHISKDALKRYQRLWDDREMFYRMLESLPQVFSHFDSQRRNLFIRPERGQQNELVAIDWAECGIGALGAELHGLVGISGYLLEWPPADLYQLDTVAFPNYIAGLQDAGWTGNIDVARLGYTGFLSAYEGCIFPGWAAWWCASENRNAALQIYESAEEELFLKLMPILNYTLDCADEARMLMKKLGIS